MHRDVAIVNISVGNSVSVSNAVSYLGYNPLVTRDPFLISSASHIILPGVGSFSSAMQELSALSLDDAICLAVNSGSKVLGICLGFQLLFNTSEEGSSTAGLNLLPGHIIKFPFPQLRLPHIGFASTSILKRGSLLHGISTESDFYYVHTYCLPSLDFQPDSLAVCSYGFDFVAAFQYKNIMGCQFHPEKSQINGMAILQNFLNS